MIGIQKHVDWTREYVEDFCTLEDFSDRDQLQENSDTSENLVATI